MKYLNIDGLGDDTFKQFLIVSTTLHVSFFMALVVKGIILSSDVIEIPPSVRIDMVALPDKLPENPTPPAPPKAELTKPEPRKETAAPPPPPPPKVNLAPKKDSTKNVKETQKKALEKLQALSAIEKLKSELAEKKEAATPAPAFKGNIISSGSSFTGLSRLRVNEYLENLTARVREHWVLPQWLSHDNLKASIVISIDVRGHIIKREVYSSSGNSIFDSSCLAAVADAAPFERPPDEVKEALIMIRFPFQ